MKPVEQQEQEEISPREDPGIYEFTNGKGVLGQLKYYQKVMDSTLSGLRNEREIFEKRIRDLNQEIETMKSN